MLKTPSGQAQQDVRRLTGLEIGQAPLHREARRQGERALRLRDADVALTSTLEGLHALSQRAQAPQSPFSLVIEIDAWNIRERDHWGETEKLRKQGNDPSRWHWVYELERIALGKKLSFLQMDASLTAVPFYKAHGFQVLERDVHVLQSGDRMDCTKMRKQMT